MKILSVNISKAKGTVKTPVDFIELDEEGVKMDAHAGRWHRQVSLLGNESFEKFEKLAGRRVSFGEFAENITTEGLLLFECRPFDQIHCGNAVLEVTQIGKKCHGDSCAIFREVGSCVMPKEGIFCRVLKPGVLQAGDTFTYHPKTIKVLVITLSDRAHSGIYEDRSGPQIRERMGEFFSLHKYPVTTDYHCLPDNPTLLSPLLKDAAGTYDFVFTTGGTGLGERDITIDTVKKCIDKEIPGVMDLIRLTHGSGNPNALLSRSVAGMMGKTALFALPGSVKAVNEYLDTIEKVMMHLLFMVHGIDNH